VKLVWLLSVPVIALVALFAVRSSPTFAGPACADACGGVVADQGMLSSYGGTYIYSQIAGQYCNDKTGGQIFVAVGAPTPSGVTCGGTATATATGTARPAATGTAAAGGTAAATTATATRTATATATASP